MPKSDTADSQEVRPDPKLEKRTRRTFTVDYKLSILQQAAVCKHSELGALLHLEKLYSNQLAQWRREFESHGVKGLSKSLLEPVQKALATLENHVRNLLSGTLDINLYQCPHGRIEQPVPGRQSRDSGLPE